MALKVLVRNKKARSSGQSRRSIRRIVVGPVREVHLVSYCEHKTSRQVVRWPTRTDDHLHDKFVSHWAVDEWRADSLKGQQTEILVAFCVSNGGKRSSGSRLVYDYRMFG